MRLDVGEVDVFQEETVPRGTKLAGWSLLVQALNIAGPVRHRSCVSQQHVRGSRRQEGDWTIFDRRYWPGDTLADHLSFALRHEPIDLLLLKLTFTAVPPAEIEPLIHAAPTGALARRLWFLYELLTGRSLDVPDAPRVTAINLLDEDAYFTGTPRISKRHRLHDNLLGTGRFCPVIRRTPALTELIALDLGLNKDLDLD